MTKRTHRALDAICDALIPSGGTIPQGALDANVPDRIDDWLCNFTPHSRRLVKALIVGYNLTPLLSRYMRPFHRLSPTEACKWVDATETSRLRPRREALAALEVIASLAYAVDPAIQAQIGYDGTPLVAPSVTGTHVTPPLDVHQYPDVTDLDVNCDVVVVGSGAGGAVSAFELAAAGLNVVVIEEGGSPDANGIPSLPPHERLFRLYRDNGLTSTVGTPVVALPMGRAVGGTTVVNSGTCFRTPEWVLYEWTQAGVPAVGPDDLAPIFEHVEDVLSVAPVSEETLGNNGVIFRKGAEKLGLSSGPIHRNARGCVGYGLCGFLCPQGAKQAMHVSYLPRAATHGARIFANCHVTNITIESGRATGVTADVTDPTSGQCHGQLRVNARAVVLAAGAIYTPALLARQRLARSSGELGRNLVIHPGAGTTARFDEEVFAWKGVMQNYYMDDKLRDGVLLEATFPPPGIGYSAGALPGHGAKFKELFAAYPNMAGCGSIISDTGAGRVRATRHGAMIMYNLQKADAAKVLEGIATACEIYLAAGASEVYPMLPGLPAVKTPAEAAKIRTGRWKPGELKLSAYHPMGTCRMGVDPARSVVDAWGQVHGTPGLWVLDASIIPSSTAVNPQITIMALATRGAHRLAEGLA